MAAEMEIPVQSGCVPHEHWKLIVTAMGYYRSVSELNTVEPSEERTHCEPLQRGFP